MAENGCKWREHAYLKDCVERLGYMGTVFISYLLVIPKSRSLTGNWLLVRFWNTPIHAHEVKLTK